jgi:hypothetical protein
MARLQLSRDNIRRRIVRGSAQRRVGVDYRICFGGRDRRRPVVIPRHLALFLNTVALQVRLTAHDRVTVVRTAVPVHTESQLDQARYIQQDRRQRIGPQVANNNKCAQARKRRRPYGTVDVRHQELDQMRHRKLGVGTHVVVVVVVVVGGDGASFFVALALAVISGHVVLVPVLFVKDNVVAGPPPSGGRREMTSRPPKQAAAAGG